MSSPQLATWDPDPCFGFAPVPGVPGAEPPAVVVAPLDPLETTSRPQCPRAEYAGEEPPWINPDAIPFEHRGWDADRRRVYAAMVRTEQPVARRQSFWDCCGRVHVFREATTSELELRPETCKDRFCLRCGQSRSRRIAHALEGRMKAASDKLMFITLTVRGLPSDRLITLLERLRNAWSQLRRLDGWRHTVRGGAIMHEVKWSKTSGGHWHPHYHIVCEGSYLDKQWLRSAWYAITGDSQECDVQHVKEPGKVISYVTKYASKPVDASFLRNCNLLDEAMRTLKGVRLCALFGEWYGTPLKEVDDGEETDVLTTWVYEGTVGDLDRRKQSGEAAATAILGVVERLLRLRAMRHHRRGSDPPDGAQSGDATGQAA